MAPGERHVVMCGMRRRFSDERGAFMVIFALVLLVLLGFTALGIEAGRWYLVRAELSKGVDAAALVGAKNISNPHVDAKTLAEEFGYENFQSGYIGTPGSGTGEVRFNATLVPPDKVHVTGNVNATAILAQLFGVTTIPVFAESTAQKRDVEIMMILDRSGSMGMPMDKMNNLKTAAKSFLSFYKETEAQDRVGLVSFAFTALMDLPLGNNFVAPMTTAITAMTPYGGTNMEEAFELAGGPGGLPDQSTLPAGSPTRQQFVVFFSDGMPTALTDKFKYKNVVYEKAVVSAGGIKDTNNVLRANCIPADYPYMTVNNYLVKPNAKITKQSEWDAQENRYGEKANVTGDGNVSSASACATETTKWYLFVKNPVPNYTAESCNIPNNYGGPLVSHFCPMARQLTLDNAEVLKNRGVKIYVVGLGTSQQLDQAFLNSLSSGPEFAYFTTDPKDLDAIFKTIAKQIKLRLVQ